MKACSTQQACAGARAAAAGARGRGRLQAWAATGVSGSRRSCRACAPTCPPCTRTAHGRVGWAERGWAGGRAEARQASRSRVAQASSKHGLAAEQGGCSGRGGLGSSAARRQRQRATHLLPDFQVLHPHAAGRVHGHLQGWARRGGQRWRVVETEPGGSGGGWRAWRRAGGSQSRCPASAAQLPHAPDPTWRLVGSVGAAAGCWRTHPRTRPHPALHPAHITQHPTNPPGSSWTAAAGSRACARAPWRSAPRWPAATGGGAGGRRREGGGDRRRRAQPGADVCRAPPAPRLAPGLHPQPRTVSVCSASPANFFSFQTRAWRLGSYLALPARGGWGRGGGTGRGAAGPGHTGGMPMPATAHAAAHRPPLTRLRAGRCCPLTHPPTS